MSFELKILKIGQIGSDLIGQIGSDRSDRLKIGSAPRLSERRTFIFGLNSMPSISNWQADSYGICGSANIFERSLCLAPSFKAAPFRLIVSRPRRPSI